MQAVGNGHDTSAHGSLFKITGTHIPMKAFLIAVLVSSTQLLWAQPALNRQGHRGARGLMPENTIPAMKKALDLGVTYAGTRCGYFQR